MTPPGIRHLAVVLCYDDLSAPPAALHALDGPLLLRRATAGARAGRGDLRLVDRWLSSEHARLEPREDRVVLRDLGSNNGTWVNGRRATELALHDGDLIEVGHTLLLFREGPPVAGEVRFGPTRTQSPAVAALVADLERLRASREPVTVLGEPGAGKTTAAAALVDGGRVVTVDCGRPDPVFDGFSPGATVVLEEPGRLGRAAQLRLLHALNGDVRWIATTSADLAGDPGFHGDLFARLSAHVLRVPPLRARREDLGLLAAHLLAAAGVTRASCTAPAGRQLWNGPFPANVRELRDRLRLAAHLAGSLPIDVAHLESRAASEPGTDGPDLTATMDERRK